MYGSLSQFLKVQKKIKFEDEPLLRQSTIQSFSQQKNNRRSILIYETQDKSIYLDSLSKNKKQIKIAQQKLRQALEEQQMAKKQTKLQKQHWVQKNHFQTSNLSAKNKLLRAIAKTRQIQSLDNKKTVFQKSFDRITSAYSKIKTQPIDVLLPPKMAEIPQIKNTQQSIPLRKKSCPVSPSKMLNLQNSVKWAKKHGKNFNSFYQQLGKSYELVSHERPGKNNYELQRQAKQKQQESKRRFIRRKFLKQIQRRLSKYASPER